MPWTAVNRLMIARSQVRGCQPTQMPRSTAWADCPACPVVTPTPGRRSVARPSPGVPWSREALRLCRPPPGSGPWRSSAPLRTAAWSSPSPAALLKDLSDRPFALVCDLAGVDILEPVCATVFSTVANHPASRWPDTSFLLCGAQPLVAEILGRLQVKPYPARRTCATSCGWPRPRPLRQRPARSCERSAGTGSSPSPTSP